MENLFPIKIEVDDYSDFLYPFFRSRFATCFIFSSQVKEKEIRIDDKNKIYNLGEIKKNEITFYIYYIEFYGYLPESGINIKIPGDSLYIKANENNNKKNFLFNQFLFDKDNKKKCKLNFFDIYEEFEIYYRIHYDQKNKNKNSLKYLISSTIYLFKNNKEESSFSFFLTVLIKDTEKIFINIFNEEKDNILLNIKNKGDLTKIKNEEIKLLFMLKINYKYEDVCLIYMILSENIVELKQLLKDNNISNLMFKCLKKYKNLFSNSLKLFPDFSFLINMSDSLDKIKIILKCSNSLTDFIYLLNEKKEIISNYIEKMNFLI